MSRSFRYSHLECCRRKVRIDDERKRLVCSKCGRKVAGTSVSAATQRWEAIDAKNEARKEASREGKPFRPDIGTIPVADKLNINRKRGR